MRQRYLRIAGNHLTINIRVVGGIVVHDKKLTVPADDIRMAAADGGIAADAVIHIAPLLSYVKDRFIYIDSLIITSPEQIGSYDRGRHGFTYDHRIFLGIFGSHDHRIPEIILLRIRGGRHFLKSSLELLRWLRRLYGWPRHLCRYRWS